VRYADSDGMVGNDAYDDAVDGARGTVVYSDSDELSPCDAVINWSLEPEVDGGRDEPDGGSEDEDEEDEE
jgi:hypothetical protein